MSKTAYESEAIPTTQTLSPIPDAHDDGSLLRELPEIRECPRLIIPVTSVAPLVVPAGENACADHHVQFPARDACKRSKQFKIGCTGTGRPRSDVTLPAHGRSLARTRWFRDRPEGESRR